MKFKKTIAVVLALLASTAVAFAIMVAALPHAKALNTSGIEAEPKPLHLTAIGDSLTHGVGDTTNQGGYVPLIAQDINIATDCKVTTSNFGKTGDTAMQIKHRLDKSTKIQNDLSRADIITVTAGGNDLMHLLQSNLLSIKTKDVDKGITKFQTHLTSLITDIRRQNPTAPIYVYGIYNPFYVYFKNIPKMQDSVKRWNGQTQKTLAGMNNTYYVDIDSVLSKGNGTDKAKGSTTNSLIFGKDHFHPNNAGYVQMTAQLWDVMRSSKEKWEK